MYSNAYFIVVHTNILHQTQNKVTHNICSTSRKQKFQIGSD